MQQERLHAMNQKNNAEVVLKWQGGLQAKTGKGFCNSRVGVQQGSCTIKASRLLGTKYILLPLQGLSRVVAPDFLTLEKLRV